MVFRFHCGLASIVALAGELTCGVTLIFLSMPAVVRPDEVPNGFLAGVRGVSAPRQDAVFSPLPCKALVELCCDLDSELVISAREAADSWSALPCTAWCTWQFINEKKLGPAFCSRLAFRRRQSIKMVGGVDECFKKSRAGGGGCHFEWPRRCRGWQRPRVRKLVLDHAMGLAHFDGCSVGVEASPGVLTLKPWTVATTRPALKAALERRRCTRDHVHGQLSGVAATR